MNKDAILATIIGFIVGLVITGLILVGPTILAKLPKMQLPTVTLPTKTPPAPTEAEKKSVTFKVDSPLAESIESSDELLVSGTAEPESVVVVQTDTSDAVAQAGADGKFAAKIKLTEGANYLSITAHTTNSSTTEKRTVYYTEEAL